MPRSTAPADTGNLATITFASGITATLKVRSIEQPDESVGNIDASVLATVGTRVFIPEDFSDPIELTIEYLWDTFDVAPTLRLNLGLVTVTYPLRSGETTPATRTGTAYVSGIKHPGLKNNELQVGVLKVQLDGAVTAQTYTPST
jgi:hypothetical protein